MQPSLVVSIPFLRTTCVSSQIWAKRPKLKALIITIHNRDSVGFALGGSEGKGVKHVKAGNRDALAPFVDMAGPRLRVSPMIPCTGIQKDGNEEQIDEATSHLGVITAFLLPLAQQVCDARYVSDFKMLPAPMRRNSVELVRTEIPLFRRLV